MSKTILVVGGRRGIGQATANQLLTTGNLVIVTSRNFTGIKAINPNHWQAHCDITNDDSIEQLSQLLEKKIGHIDWLINCAGILHNETFMPEKSLQQTSNDQYIKSFATNAIGHLNLIKSLGKLIQVAENPVIASISARIGSIDDNKLGGWYAYRMSKAALNMGIKTLAIEWHRTHPNVKFLLLHPGTTDTDLSAPFQKNLPKGQLQSVDSTASMIIEQIKLNQNHNSKFPLFIDYKGNNIRW